MSFNLIEIKEISNNLHPKLVERHIEYGTAGFRTKGSDLDSVVFRMGLMASLRSKNVNGAVIGIMITASHNPEEDNGVKLVDPMGEMFAADWEASATILANSPNDDLDKSLQEIISLRNIDLKIPCNVYIACDTRPSSPSLVKAAINGANLFGAAIKNFGCLTTPQLHYMVRCTNTGNSYGEATEEGYYRKLSSAFVNLNSQIKSGANYTTRIIVDGANGVGALKMKLLEPYLNELLKVEIYNSSGRLNYQCGADFVKIQQKPPDGLPLDKNTRCVSFDGDADRIIYFYLDQNDDFRMLDGDKIASLIARFLKTLTEEANLNLKILMVQTAYANGSSTKYISDVLGVEVAFVPTGVKYLHHKAQEADIGIYFEANGHGTVVFSDNAVETISLAAQNKTSQGTAAKNLLAVIDIINQTVGDALSDMLLVETILRYQDWEISDWNNTYQDLPNRQLKVMVKDRKAISTTDAERRCEKPNGVQISIDKLVKGHPNWRAFIRPSGTEDIVRVYAEADTQAEADNLVCLVSHIVYDFIDGVGPKPCI